MRAIRTRLKASPFLPTRAPFSPAAGTAPCACGGCLEQVRMVLAGAPLRWDGDASGETEGRVCPGRPSPAGLAEPGPRTGHTEPVRAGRTDSESLNVGTGFRSGGSRP